ncbi:hypothetical protein [Massilia sp. DD77]|uniref:hypothetical protein n=1 Tax=Massilia sp. DD77 TaxID=3109349 RepID=UPI002FFE656D
MDPKKNFSVAPPAVGADNVKASPTAIASPAPPPGINLSEDELQVYDYLCESLRDAGIDHLTVGMPLAVIVRTFIDWINASKECAEKGRSQTSKTGWSTPTPWAEDEKRLKMELGQWLPKACLTIPSLARVRKDTGVQGGQDDLFSDLVSHATSSPANASKH